MTVAVAPRVSRDKDLRFRREMLRHYRAHRRVFPWRETRDPYEVLVGELLLQRTRGENVAGVYDRFIRLWPDARALGRADTHDISDVIRPLGLVKRAATLRRLGEELQYSDPFPTDRDQLAALPGVGPYIAHAVPIFARGRNLPLVDWVIARVMRRYYGGDSQRRPNGDRALWDLAARLASMRRARELWLGTLDFAASVCKPRPLCEECPLSGGCEFFARRRDPPTEDAL